MVSWTRNTIPFLPVLLKLMYDRVRNPHLVKQAGRPTQCYNLKEMKEFLSTKRNIPLSVLKVGNSDTSGNGYPSCRTREKAARENRPQRTGGGQWRAILQVFVRGPQSAGLWTVVIFTEF